MSEQSERTQTGARLKKAREYCGFSQEEVARFLGVSRSSVSLMESGSRGVDVLELRRLATLYQCSVGELIGESTPPNTDSIEIVARAAQDLKPEDQQEVVRFAQFLKNRRQEVGSDESKR